MDFFLKYRCSLELGAVSAQPHSIIWTEPKNSAQTSMYALTPKLPQNIFRQFMLCCCSRSTSLTIKEKHNHNSPDAGIHTMRIL